MRPSVVGALIVAMVLPVAAGRAEPRLGSDRAKDDAALLRDEAKATSELQRRLRDQVAFKDGLLVIQDRSASAASVVVMPPTAFWSVDCGDNGIGVTFGSGSGDTDNGIALQLTAAAPTQEQCLALAPALAKSVAAIVKGE